MSGFADTMWGYLSAVVSYLQMLTLELILCGALEMAVKNEIQKMRTMSEKRNIWFCQIFILFVLGYAFSLFLHFPLFLWGMAVVMILYFLLQTVFSWSIWQDLEYFVWWRDFEALMHNEGAEPELNEPLPRVTYFTSVRNFLSRIACAVPAGLSYLREKLLRRPRESAAVGVSSQSHSSVSPVNRGGSVHEAFTGGGVMGSSYQNIYASGQNRPPVGSGLVVGGAQYLQDRPRSQFQTIDLPVARDNFGGAGNTGVGAPSYGFQYGSATGSVVGSYPSVISNHRNISPSTQQNPILDPPNSMYNRSPSDIGYPREFPQTGLPGANIQASYPTSQLKSNDIPPPVVYNPPGGIQSGRVVGDTVSPSQGTSEQTSSHWMSSVKNFITSSASTVLGAPSQSGFTPGGLPNGGNNLCFLNSALQLLCRTPSFNTSLTMNLHDCGGLSCLQDETMRRFTDMLMRTFGVMTRGNSSSSPPTSGWIGLGGRGDPALPADTRPLRAVLSGLGGGLVLHPDDMKQQPQQDVTEVLMWLMDRLSTALNRKRGAAAANGKPGYQYPQNSGSYTTTSTFGMDLATRDALAVKNAAQIFMIQLRHKYGNDTVQDIRAGARRAISENAIRTTLFNLGLVQLSDADWLEQRQQNDSLVNDYFVGQLMNVRRCLGCHSIHVSSQPFSILTVNISPEEDTATLEDCLARTYNVTERLSEANSLRCDQCLKTGSTAVLATPIHSGILPSLCRPPLRPETDPNDLIYSPVLSSNGIGDGPPAGGFSTSTPISGENSGRLGVVEVAGRSPCDQLTLLRLPGDCLALHLLRFNVSPLSNQASKITTRVRFPLGNLCLHPFTVDALLNGVPADTHRYFLYAFCVHLGSASTSSGHYVTYACCDVMGTGTEVERGQAWFQFDDDRVTPVDIEAVVTSGSVQENVYLLMYRKARTTQF